MKAWQIRRHSIRRTQLTRVTVESALRCCTTIHPSKNKRPHHIVPGVVGDVSPHVMYCLRHPRLASNLVVKA
ncbi:MAG: hypothetical protein ACK55I_42435 [bacterium]